MNVALLSVVTLLSCAASPTIDQVLDGICMVESSGGKDKRDGDDGKAIGPYQIHKAYWVDGTRLLKVKWPYSEARNETRARSVVKAYITHYGKGHGTDGMIRCHNGGPKGYQKKSTLIYLQKVKKAIEDAKKEKK